MVLILVPALLLVSTAEAKEAIEFYTRDGCPRCQAAYQFLESEIREHPGMSFVTRDVVRDRDARNRLKELARKAGITAPGVPAFVFQDRVLIGFDPDTTPARFRALLDGYESLTPESGTCEVQSSECERVSSANKSIDLPVIGRVSVDTLGLPVFTIVVGLIDGLNPCAIWVLLFLLAMLANLENRSRMAIIAGTFVVVSGIVYFAFMAAWLTLFVAIGISKPVRFVLAGFAVIVGALNVKDFFAFGRGPSLGIPSGAKHGLYNRVRRILRAENLAGAMAGIVVLAFLVNLVELMCTAGLPALYSAILTGRDIDTWQYYAYLGLYVAAYMVDDAILVTIGVVTLGKRKLQKRGGRWLKLISGLVILTLGVLLLARPQLLGF